MECVHRIPTVLGRVERIFKMKSKLACIGTMILFMGASCPNSNPDSQCTNAAKRLEAELVGPAGDRGEMEYHVSAANCREFHAEVNGFDAGTQDVTVAGVVVGQISVDASGTGELEFDTQIGNFPANFPDLVVGDAGDVGGIASGQFVASCPANFRTCPPVGGCGEDAAEFVEAHVKSIQVLDRGSSCGIIAPTLQTRTASVNFTNTHPSRTIAIAAIIIYQSNKQSLPKSPCQYAIDNGVYS